VYWVEVNMDDNLKVRYPLRVAKVVMPPRPQTPGMPPSSHP